MDKLLDRRPAVLDLGFGVYSDFLSLSKLLMPRALHLKRHVFGAGE
jgi:hypothetical protein